MEGSAVGVKVLGAGVGDWLGSGVGAALGDGVGSCINERTEKGSQREECSMVLCGVFIYQ